MRRLAHALAVLACAGVVAGCAHRYGAEPPMSDALFTVVHKKPASPPFKRAPFRYMYYYRTEVRNLSNRPLKIVWFEGYGEDDGHWYPGNILGRVLREREFSEWYTEGDTVTDGVIPPGKTAVCDVNWHGSASPEPLRAKWAYIAVDPWGNDYFVEAVVDPEVVERVDHGESAGDSDRAPLEDDPQTMLRR